MTFEEIRRAVKNRCDEPDSDLVALYHFGFAHELPLIGIAIVLVSAVVRGTIDVNRLSDFTGYSKAFIAAIASNMANSGLWKNGSYDASDWSPDGNPLPRNEREDAQFWEHIDVADGTCWAHDAKSTTAADPSAIFWEDKACERARV